MLTSLLSTGLLSQTCSLDAAQYSSALLCVKGTPCSSIRTYAACVQVSSERDAANEANVLLKAELERFRGVTGSTVDALEREKAVKAQLENQNKAQVQTQARVFHCKPTIGFFWSRHADPSCCNVMS